MIKQNIKLLIWISIIFIGFLLFNSWQYDVKNINQYNVNDAVFDSNAINYNYNDQPNLFKNEIFIDTDLISVKINLNGGDITYLSLKKYLKSLNKENDGGIVIFDDVDKYYFAQSGILNNFDLNNKSYIYSSDKVSYKLNKGDSFLEVILNYDSEDITMKKIYTFSSFSYSIKVGYLISNKKDTEFRGKLYGLLKQKISTTSSFFNTGIKSYEGIAFYTKDKPYKKVSYDSVSSKKPCELVNGGWISMIEHYFLSSWIPFQDFSYIYSVENLKDNLYIAKYISEKDFIISPGEFLLIESNLFVGPKIKSELNNLANGLNLAIDYGIFWPIASPIFFILSKIYNFVGNWGLSIILVTVLIKLFFFQLSSISYKSMGNMKKIQPKLDILKERYKDDKKKFGQEVMELYKKEKVNPFSGCLPILIQIPVFISLYYVLLESVELRHSPFIFWLNDLSSKDPYYILPIIMSFTMYLQQKLNPPVQDPLQNKIMMFMPVFFLILFLQFPSGLILYWIVNNILSIIQQWVIMNFNK